jgi:colanic acid/amylovoran biosynthesis glycosyltransferase
VTSSLEATGSRPRLLVVASTYPVVAGDGTPSFVADLAAVQAEEFATTVLVPSVRGSRREQCGELTVERFRYFFRRYEDLADGAILENLRARASRWLQVLPFLLGELLAMRRLLRQNDADVLHVHWLVPQGVAAWLVAGRVPWLLTCHGADVYALRGPVSRRIKRAVLSRAAAVTTVNEDMRNRVIALGADPDRTHVVAMPAALSTGAAAGLDPIRDESAGGPDVVPGRLLFVGRLVEKKGVTVLLDALRLFPAEVRFTCEIVGAGPLRDGLRRRVAELGLADRVTFLGQVDKQRVARALAEAEVVIVPSVPAASGDQDGLPVTLLEAMGRARPIVASRLPGIVEAVEHERAALLVPPGDAAALAAALGRLLTDADLRDRLGRAAAERARDYTPTNIGRQYNALLRSLVPPARPAPYRRAGRNLRV